MLTTPPDRRQDVAFASHLPAVVGLALFGAILRLWRVDQGLPDFTEEAIPWHQALEMWGWDTGRTDLNPGFFNYPTLTIYLHFLLQKAHYAWGLLRGAYATPADYWLMMQIDPTGAVVLARLVGIAADCAAVVAAWRVGQQLRGNAGFAAGMAVALAATLIATARSIYVDPVQGALTIWTAERLLAYQVAGRRAQLVTAVVLLGLAAGAKYNGGLLVIPLAWVLVTRHRRHGLLLWPLAAGGALAVFVATSPYVLLDFDSFWRDFGFERVHMSEGHLGTLGTRGTGTIARLAWDHLGPPFLLAVAGGLVTLPWRKARRRELTVWLVLLPPALAVGLFRMVAPRYLVPLVPPAAVLAAVLVTDLSAWLARRRGWRLSWVRLGGYALLILPMTVAGWRASISGADTTQACARRWCEEHLRGGEIVVQELYGPKLRNDFDDLLVSRRPPFAGASPALRARFAAEKRHRTVTVPMMASGGTHVVLTDASGRSHRLRVLAHGSEFNQVFYRTALLNATDYFVRSEAVAGRYEADPLRYPRQVRFYEWLAAHAEEAWRCSATLTRAGPEIVIYRLGDEARRLLRDRNDELDHLWWAESIPASYRREVQGMLPAAASGSARGVRLSDGRPAPWVRSLRQLFERFVLPYLLRKAQYFGDAGHHEASAWAAGAALAMMPELEPACLAFSRAQENLGRPDLALAALRRGIAARNVAERPIAVLQLEVAAVLAAAEQYDEAAAAARLAVAAAPSGSEVARRAAALLEHLDATKP